MSTDTQLCPRIHIATDHAGLDLSADLVRRLAAKGYEVVDHGPKTYDPQDDYPAFCIRAAQAVITDRQSGRHALGIVLGGSGNGEQIAANKVKGIRAALVWNHSTAVLAREHNDANVVALGARQHSAQETFDLVEAFLQTPFSNDERHARRIGQIALFENAGSVME
ncbi:ribose-5-phosphate isomerase [Pseudarthrobacter sp. fls2-241-R2A-168]|uniref:ribose-5-phosphate isomerase n=1 Tax=Pseudarthrobacter sp. fls2-241-R2A-168 TaxID=3040304 RepID=UPI00255658AC|nr:ribose-5-phosphate isomerase [Pseudarthrobacter sp. fls2-241-R2A-168]